MTASPRWALAGIILLSPALGFAQAEAPAPADAPADAEPAPAEPAGAAEPPPETAPAEASPDAAPTTEASTDSGVVVEGGSLFEDGLAGDPEAPSDSMGGEAVPAGAALGFDLNGYVRGDSYFGKDTESNAATLSAGYGELAFQLRTERQTYGDAYSDLRFRYGQQGDENDLFIDLREAYVNAYLGPLDLRLGKQIVVWGRADAFNPTNNITPVDLNIRSPIEDDRRIGKFGARAFLNFAPFRLEGVWMPLYVPTEFPPISLEDGVTLLDPVIPGPNLDNGLGAGRLHLELPSFEASVSYLYGKALLPGFERIDYDVGANASVVVQRRVYTHEVIGADFSTAIGDTLALRGEAAYKGPINYEAIYTPRREISYVLGLDRAFGSLSVIAQYVGKYVIDWEKEGEDNPASIDDLGSYRPADLEVPATRETIEGRIDEEIARRNQVLFQQTERIQHIATVRLEYLALHDTLSLSALGMYNFTTQEWLLFPKILYKFSDALSGSVGGEIYNGPENTLLDFLDQTLTAGYAELRYSF